jgi:hypothetical protein
MKNDENLIYEKYINLIIKEEFSSSINRKGKYALWGFGLHENRIGEGMDMPKFDETVEEVLLTNDLVSDVMMTGVMNDMGYETTQDKDVDVRLSDSIVKSIGCTLDDDPLLIKGRYEAAIAYKIRMCSVLKNNIFIVTDDKRFSTWKLADENFEELKNIAKNSLAKLLASGKSSKHLIPGITYAPILPIL